MLSQAIRDNPDILWEDVRPETTRYCGCVWEDDLNRSVMKAAIDNKTVTETMLRELGREVPLNWKNICRMVPLSVSALEEYQDQVDWERISMLCICGYMYSITYEFVERFGHRLDWSKINFSNFEAVSQQEFENLVFENRKIPLDWACRAHFYVFDGKPTQHYHFFLPEPLLKQHIHDLVNAQLLPELVRRNFEMFDRLYQNCSNETWFTQLAECDDFIMQIKKHSDKLERYLTPFKLSQTYRDRGWNPLITCLSEQQLRSLVLPDKNKFSWYNLSCRKSMSDSFLNEFADQLHWKVVSRYTKLSHDNLRAFANRLDLEAIARHQYLPEDIIERFAKDLDWDDLCWYQKLSENLIEAHLTKLNWGNISSVQALSKEFVKKYRQRLNFIKLKSNPHIKFDLSDL